MSHKFYLPTYQECLAICQANENFFEKKSVVNNLEVSVFNYRLASLEDFISPLGKDSPVMATELRGITFVHDGLPQRNLMLHKFFNIDQTDGYMLSQIIHKKIKRVQDKLDGSMVRFLKVGDQIVSKTKVSFENEQTRLAQMIMLRDKNLQGFVKETLDNGLVAIFEFVSPMNQIVLQYGDTKLVLLQLRVEETGEYLDIYSHPLVSKYGIELATQEEILTFESFMEKKKTDEGREGWILTLEDGQMAKVKTQWYMDRHGILTEGLIRENSIIAMIINETLDDAMAMVGEKDPRRGYSNQIQKALSVYLEQSLKETKTLLSSYSKIESSLVDSIEDKDARLKEARKQFALQNKDKVWFGVAIRNLFETDEDVLYKAVKNVVLDKNKNLMEAKSFVENTLQVKALDLFIDTDG